MSFWSPDVCIYHGGCDDGFGAAWAIWRHWPKCEFIAGRYGDDLPDLSDKDVVFVDFSAPRDVLVDMSFKCRSVVVIDHHKTAEAALQGLPPFNGTLKGLEQAFEINQSQNTPRVAVWFDMQQSGATMAWQFASDTDRQESPPPHLISFIEDRDLWKFVYGDHTRQFSAALRTYPQDFEVWDELACNVERLIAEGETVLRSHRANLKKIIAEVYQADVGGFTVPVVNAPYHYASEAAHELLALHPEAPFTACWFRRGDGQIQWSLRSEDHREDVSAVAKAAGGGGHRNAAGFQEEA